MPLGQPARRRRVIDSTRARRSISVSLKDHTETLIDLALAEDLGDGTAALLWKDEPLWGGAIAIEERSGGVVRSPAPAMIVSVAVQEGDVVKPGDRLATLEAMKMEIPLHAQEAGRIVSVRCQANQQVAAGQIIMTLQPEGESQEADVASERLGAPAQPGALEQLRVGDRWDISRLDAMSEQTAAEVVEEVVPVMDKGDVSWMMVSTVLVLFMTLPGLALFYGGLVRSKNMLSILMQTTVIACVMMER